MLGSSLSARRRESCVAIVPLVWRTSLGGRVLLRAVGLFPKTASAAADIVAERTFLLELIFVVILPGVWEGLAWGTNRVLV
mgnify:CR=1 FL=1